MSDNFATVGQQLPIVEFIASLTIGVVLYVILEPAIDKTETVALDLTTNETAETGLRETMTIIDHAIAIFIIIGFIGLITFAAFVRRR